MTSLKAMDDEDRVFTITVTDGQLTISLPVAAITEDYEEPYEFSSWLKHNTDRVDETCRVAIKNEEAEAKTKEQAAKTVQK